MWLLPKSAAGMPTHPPTTERIARTTSGSSMTHGRLMHAVRMRGLVLVGFASKVSVVVELAWIGAPSSSSTNAAQRAARRRMS
jgi:hypothetical protein